MPKDAQYSLDWSPEHEGYLLTEAETGTSFLLDEAGEAWQEWLEDHRSFAFHGRIGSSPDALVGKTIISSLAERKQATNPMKNP